MDYQIVPLTKELLAISQQDLLFIDQEAIAERWEERNFSIDLPGKWKASHLVLDGDKVIGFMIATFKSECVHVNRIAVNPTQQGRGIGTRLLQYAARSAQQHQKPFVTLKVSRQNQDAIRFYKRRGFRIKTADDENLILYIEPGELLVSKERNARN